MKPRKRKTGSFVVGVLLACTALFAPMRVSATQPDDCCGARMSGGIDCVLDYPYRGCGTGCLPNFPTCCQAGGFCTM